MKAKRLSILLAALLTAAASAHAGPATEVVRPFYGDRIAMESDPASRSSYIDPAKRQLDLNDETNDAGELGCVDFGLAIDAQDFDDAEVRRTVKFDEKVSGDSAIVIASFSNFGHKTRIEWKLKRVGGQWKIADIASPDNDWRLSEFACEVY